MANARERLLELTQQRGSSLAGLSELLGRNSSYLQQFIRKGSPRKLEENDRRTLAEYFGVPESELGGGEEKSYASAPVRSDWIVVPRVPLGASAGPGRVAEEERPFDTMQFSRRWLRDHGLDGTQLAALRVDGDSMEPLLRDGDEILVDRRPQPLREGIHVVRRGDTLSVKRIALAGEGRIALLSQNMAYPPVELAIGEIEVIGRVVWKGGRI